MLAIPTTTHFKVPFLSNSTDIHGHAYIYVCVCNISPLLLPPSNLRKYENEKSLQHFLIHTQTHTDSLLTVAIALRGRKIRGPCSPQVGREMPICIHHDRGVQTLAFLRILGVVQW